MTSYICKASHNVKILFTSFCHQTLTMGREMGRISTDFREEEPTIHTHVQDCSGNQRQSENQIPGLKAVPALTS